MDAEQTSICEFLRSWPGQFVSGKEICRRAAGKWRYREDENWALPILQGMLEQKLVDADAAGHFRLVEERHRKEEKKVLLSPEIKELLRRAGETFDDDEVTEQAEANAAS